MLFRWGDLEARMIERDIRFSLTKKTEPEVGVEPTTAPLSGVLNTPSLLGDSNPGPTVYKTVALAS